MHKCMLTTSETRASIENPFLDRGELAYWLPRAEPKTAIIGLRALENSADTCYGTDACWVELALSLRTKLLPWQLCALPVRPC